ncbi:MAG: hypothetical protein ACXVCP_07285 [Bdellovibrio sp.]
MTARFFNILSKPYCLTAFVLFLVITKAPKLFFAPAFYGEEGTIFYSEQLKFGWSSLTTSYAGYLHTYPRLVALITSNFPLENIPFFYHLSSLLAQGLLLYAVFRFAGSDPKIRILSALATVIIPHGGEAYLNLPNAISILGPIVPLLYFAEKASLGRTIFEILLVGLSMLTGPYAIISLPFLFAAWIFQRCDRRKIPFLVTCVLFAVLHVSFFKMQVRTGHQTTLTFVGLLDAFTTFFYSLFFVFFGVIKEFWVRFVVTVICSLITWRFIKETIISKGNFAVALPLILSGLAIWAAAIFKGLGDYVTFNPVGAGARYFWVPYVLVCIGLIQLLKSMNGHNQKTLKILCGLVALSAIVRWPSQINSSLPGWREEIEKAPPGPVLVRALPNSDWNFMAVKK